jgi:maltose O-acetyltransferase
MDMLADYNKRPSRQLLAQLLRSVGSCSWVAPPFYCENGANISVGDRFYAGPGCTIADCTRVTIGDRVTLASRVELRATEAPITIGNDAWIGAGTVVLPGVTIGARAVVGAGSVVSSDIPADCVVVGDPAHPLREVVAA